MTKSSKASLTKQLRNKGIPIPSGATITTLKHRLDNWEGGSGYLFRLAKVPNSTRESPAQHLIPGEVCWVPNSEFARDIFKTKLVFYLGRVRECPNNATLVDVPEEG